MTVAERRKRRMDALPMGIMVQLLANVNRDSEKRFQPFELDEVLSWMGYPPESEAPRPEPQTATPDELRQKLALLATMYSKGNGERGEGT